MIAASCLAALLAAAPARANEEPIDCPSGTYRVSTDNPYEPFRCASAEDGNKKLFGTMRLRCPRGTRPAAETGVTLQPYRCVPVSSDPQDPELAPMRGDGAAPPAADGVKKLMTKLPPPRSRALDANSYGRFSIPRQIAFEYPAAFRVQDAWKEEVPTLYLKIDDAAAGKPVTITITRYTVGQSAYQEMSAAIGHDVEWQGAKEGAAQLIGRARARVTDIPGDTRSVYLPVSKESYYSFVYSAPADAYDHYLPAFSRLLKSLKLAGSAR